MWKSIPAILRGRLPPSISSRRKMGDMAKPSRSDGIQSREEQLRMEQNVREQFDAIAPKRHTKPLRSEYSTQYEDALPPQTSGEEIPEYKRFQQLESHAEHLAYAGGGATEEFVETEYYKDLNAVDKQHHTTGTGFIHVDCKDDGDFHLRPEDDDFAHHPIKGNPATNDWIPSPQRVDITSSKPLRSESYE